MKIGRGGGPKGPTGPKGAGPTGKAQGAKFGGMVGQTAANGTEEANRVQSAMMQEVTALAAELASGRATREEASRRFVKMVMKRYGQNKGKGAPMMEEQVGEYFESTPDADRLIQQLQRIARGG